MKLTSAERQTTEEKAAAERYGLVAGNGQFPFQVLEAARKQGIEMPVFAIREEASPELERAAERVHWLSLGEAKRLLEILKTEGINRIVLAGQVKHNKLYSSIPPDSLMQRMLGSLKRKNTNALLGIFIRMLEERGIQVVDSTAFLKPLLARAGTLTRRAPDADEAADLDYGREVAKRIAGLDIGQTVVVRERACIAVEAMEGTDAAIERAASLSNGKRLAVVKVARPRQDMRFDVPVVGIKTIRTMQRCRATALAVDASKTLLFDRQELLALADEAGIAVVGVEES